MSIYTNSKYGVTEEQLEAYHDAQMKAQMVSYHTFFDTHVIEREDGRYSVFLETDYRSIPTTLIDLIVYTAPGQMEMAA